MIRDEHVVTMDSAGCFYCRAVDSVLNYKKDQQVCGRGCPCFVRSGQGQFVCCYKDEKETGRHLRFPVVAGMDMRLHQAYVFAAQAHANQYRKGTDIPYFTHIITTMNYAFGLTQDIEVLQAAILHDTIEDTSVTADELREHFGERVAAMVKAETEDKRRSIPASQTWKIRKKETIERLRNQPLDVKKIVLADKTANMESLVREWRRVGDSIWEKFNQKDKGQQEWYFRSMREHLTELDNTEVMAQFDTYIETLFGGNNSKKIIK